MVPVNPYAPPQAAVADVADGADGYQPVKMFSWRGRIGRLRFMAFGMVGYFAMLIAAAILGAIAGFAGSRGAAFWLGMLATIPYFVYMVFLGIQRSHDMDWNGWTVLLMLIPIVGLVWIFKGGTPQANRYGAPPPPNTTLVKIGAFFFPAIFVLGMLAAIALPAYQQYTLRAKAGQLK